METANKDVTMTLKAHIAFKWFKFHKSNYISVIVFIYWVWLGVDWNNYNPHVTLSATGKVFNTPLLEINNQSVQMMSIAMGTYRSFTIMGNVKKAYHNNFTSVQYIDSV